MNGATSALSVRALCVAFRHKRRWLNAVRDLDLDLRRHETLALVGESGSGKSAAATALMRLHPSGSTRVAGSATLDDTDLLTCPEKRMRSLRGNRIAMIFQDPMSALNPVMPVGRQIAEAIQCHTNCSQATAWQRAVELLDEVHVPDARRRAGELPHQLSGGMRQRVTIACAIAGNPSVLIADEPTTALDVTIQAQILDLLAELQARLGMAMILITHDLAVVSAYADRVAVMYAGRKIEERPVAELFATPWHPYTRALIDSRPNPAKRLAYLSEIPGMVPPPDDASDDACAFAPRCVHAQADCRATRPMLSARGAGGVACFHAFDRTGGPAG